MKNRIKVYRKPLVMFKAKLFYIFLFLTIIETASLLFLKRGLEMGYLDAKAIVFTVFSFAFFNLCSFIWVYFITKNK